MPSSFIGFNASTVLFQIRGGGVAGIAPNKDPKSRRKYTIEVLLPYRQ